MKTLQPSARTQQASVKGNSAILGGQCYIEQCFPDFELSWHSKISKHKLCSTHRMANVLFLPTKDNKNKTKNPRTTITYDTMIPPMIFTESYSWFFNTKRKQKGQNLRIKNVSPLDGIFLAL